MTRCNTRQLVLAILLAFSLVLAGCNGFAPGTDKTPERTVAPAEVPTDRPASTPVPQLAPGLTGKGVTNPFVLSEAHTSALDNISYTRHTTSIIRYTNGTIYNKVTTRKQYATNDGRFYGMQNGTGVDVRGSDTLSMWSNGERVFMKETLSNSTTYSVPTDEQYRSFRNINNQIGRIFGSVETRVIKKHKQSKPTLYRVVASSVTNPTAFEHKWRNARDVTLRALISSQGIVREYDLNYTATLNGSTIRVHRQVRYTTIGNTTVERPSWYDEATDNALTNTRESGYNSTSQSITQPRYTLRFLSDRS